MGVQARGSNWLAAIAVLVSLAASPETAGAIAGGPGPPRKPPNPLKDTTAEYEGCSLSWPNPQDIGEFAAILIGTLRGALEAELKAAFDPAGRGFEARLRRDGGSCKLVFPKIYIQRPVYFVELVPRQGQSALLPFVDQFVGCLFKKMDEWLIVPLFDAATRNEEVVPANLRREVLKRMAGAEGGPSRRGSYYEAHVFQFEFNPYDPIFENAAHPEQWATAMMAEVKVKPCYFSELDPLRWRFGVPWPPTEEELAKTYRIWEGLKSGEAEKDAPLRDQWLSIGPMNAISGHVVHSNPIVAAEIAALRAAFYATRGGLGSLCRGSDAEDIFAFDAVPGTTAGDRLKAILSTQPPQGGFGMTDEQLEQLGEDADEDLLDLADHEVKAIDLDSILQKAAEMLAPTDDQIAAHKQELSKAWENRPPYSFALSKPGDVQFTRNLAIQMVYPERWGRPRLIGWRPTDWKDEPQAPAGTDHFAFLIWKEQKDCLAGETMQATVDIVARGLEEGIALAGSVFSGGATEAALRAKQVADIAQDVLDFIEKIQTAVRQIFNLVERIKALAKTIQELQEALSEAMTLAKDQFSGALVNGAIQAVAIALEIPEAAGYVYTAECALDTGYKALDTIATLGSFEACGKGLSDVKAIAGTVSAMTQARNEVKSFLEDEPLRSALPDACGKEAVHSTIREIHHGKGTPSKPQLPSVAYIHQKAQLLADVRAGLDLACTGVKLIKNPPRNFSDLAGAFVQVPTPNHPDLKRVQDVLGTIETLRHTRDLETMLRSAREQTTLPASDAQAFARAVEKLQQDLRALNFSHVGDVRKAVARMGSADFLTDLGKHVETELKQFVDQLKDVGFPDKELNQLQSSGKGVMRSAKRFFKLMANLDSAGKEEVFEGIIALATFSSELQAFSDELAANSASLETRVQQAVDRIRNNLQPLAKDLADHIRDIPDAYARQIESSFQILPTAQIATIAADLRAVESEGRTLGAKGHAPAIEFGRAAGKLATQLESLPQVTLTSASLGPVMAPLRSPLNTVAGQIEDLGTKLADLFDRLMELAQSLGVLGGPGGGEMAKQTDGLFGGKGVQDDDPNEITLARVIASIGMFAKLQSQPNLMLAAARKIASGAYAGMSQEEAFGRAVRETLNPSRKEGETDQNIEDAAAGEFKRSRDSVRPFESKDLDKPHPATGLTQREIQDDELDSPTRRLRESLKKDTRNDPEFIKSRCELQRRLAEGRGEPPPEECR
ncbi:MAG: hypothetical protein HYY13_11095 [Nitrospirae bacterium]|nr:hypothetical protein [Nitrospirota bacterium]